jgi:ADP-ribosylglycohydrolase
VPLAHAIDVARTCCTSYAAHEETVHALDAAVQVATARGRALHAHDLLALGEGWVAEEALAIAVACALAHPDSFVDATCLAANLVRGDSDSTASMTGQLVALGVGVEGLPSAWLDQLELCDVITQVADDLAVGWRAGAEWTARWPGRRRGASRCRPDATAKS